MALVLVLVSASVFVLVSASVFVLDENKQTQFKDEIKEYICVVSIKQKNLDTLRVCVLKLFCITEFKEQSFFK